MFAIVFDFYQLQILYSVMCSYVEIEKSGQQFNKNRFVLYSVLTIKYTLRSDILARFKPLLSTIGCIFFFYKISKAGKSYKCAIL